MQKVKKIVVIAVGCIFPTDRRQASTSNVKRSQLVGKAEVVGAENITRMIRKDWNRARKSLCVWRKEEEILFSQRKSVCFGAGWKGRERKSLGINWLLAAIARCFIQQSNFFVFFQSVGIDIFLHGESGSHTHKITKRGKKIYDVRRRRKELFYTCG